MAKQVFIHTRLSRAYLSWARLPCYVCHQIYLMDTSSPWKLSMTLMLKERTSRTRSNTLINKIRKFKALITFYKQWNVPDWRTVVIMMLAAGRRTLELSNRLRTRGTRALWSHHLWHHVSFMGWRCAGWRCRHVIKSLSSHQHITRCHQCPTISGK